MLLHLQAVGGSYCDGANHEGSEGGLSCGDSYCEILVEGNWNSIGVRSWLQP